MVKLSVAVFRRRHLSCRTITKRAIGHFYDVITNGYGVMYPYVTLRVAPDDRWAIAAYIRALQLSHNANLQAVPPNEQSKSWEASHHVERRTRAVWGAQASRMPSPAPRRRPDLSGQQILRRNKIWQKGLFTEAPKKCTRGACAPQSMNGKH